MALVPLARASALPDRFPTALPPSPLRRLSALASTRGDDIAYVVATATGLEFRSWTTVETTVQQAAAGLVRSGMRADQIVLSLLPPTHAHPELDIALRAIGAVVIHVSPQTPQEDLVRELAGVDVRLVVSSDEQELTRLAGLQFRSAEMLDLGDDSWSRLLGLGAERLVMDPDVVTRVDRVVDPDGTAARVLPSGAALARVPSGDELAGLLPADAVTLLVGDPGDGFVHRVRDAHLASGGTLVHVAAASDLPDALTLAQPAALALDARAAASLSDLIAEVSVPGARRLRPGRTRAAHAVALRSWAGPHLTHVVVPDLSEEVCESLRSFDVEAVLVGATPSLAADLPVPPPVLVGDASTLPRRSRGEPGREFGLRTDVEMPSAPSYDEPAEPGESAFVLPSLPLFGGESFLDKLLISQARQGES
ncbi:AMP-binding protein [Nocardioides hwasunensis]|uniref:AMP-binding protein n=1 Tax=Nocardioides hwasunensis TaxID=397258 RepID=A0ABR8MCC9_9ACTN|nr:AMP-binding protein [Nocardioides hwasunensis]MBD3913783.1 AMP-binding protein [Nocardioides hwasunensis]